MSDARWLDVEDDVAAAAKHFTNAQSLYANGRFDDLGIEGYRDGMALMHALQAGHTSAEAAMLRVLRILGEQAPTGDDWHKKLIERLAKGNGAAKARPALLSPAVRRDLDETRRFRNRAMRSYEDFEAPLAEPALQAAERLATSLTIDISNFKAAMDPR